MRLEVPIPLRHWPLLNRRDFLGDTLTGLSGTFELLVSNPPYIPSGDISDLDPEVRHYDPRGALDGGPDGLDIFRDIARDLSCAVPHGWAVFEVGAGQAERVVEIFNPGHRHVTRIRRDLGGHQRAVAVWTQS